MAMISGASVRNASPSNFSGVSGGTGGKAYRHPLNADVIVSEDEQGKLTEWKVKDLGFQFRTMQSDAAQIPFPVRMEFARFCISEEDRHHEFFANVLPHLAVSEEARLNLAKSYAATLGNIHRLSSFDIRSADQQVELVSYCIENGIQIAPAFSALLDNASPAQRRELALRLAEKEPQAAYYLNTIRLCPEDLREFALRAARAFGVDALQYMPAGCFENPTCNLEIAKLCGPDVLQKRLLNLLEITDPNTVFELARLFTATQSLKVSRRLDRLSLSAEKTSTLMQDCLRAGPVADASLARHFDTDPDFSYRWILSCAHNDSHTASKFDAALIPNPEQRLQIACACVEFSPETAGEHLHQFELTETERINTLALACANANHGIMTCLHRLPLAPNQVYTILCICTNHQFFIDLVSADVMRQLPTEQLLSLIHRLATYSSEKALALLDTLRRHDILPLTDAMTVARELAIEGCAPNLIVSALHADAPDPLGRELFAFWLYSSPSHAQLREQFGNCYIHFLAASSHSVLDSLKSERFESFSDFSDKLPAICGESAYGLQTMDTQQIDLLAGLIQKDNFKAFFAGQRTEAGVLEWHLRPDANFTKLIKQLNKRVTAEECIATLRKLRITGKEAVAKGEWLTIGEHARSIAAFRSLAQMKPPEDESLPEVSEDLHISWTDHQLRWMTAVLILIESRALPGEHVRALLPLLQHLATMKDLVARNTLTALAFQASRTELAALADCTSATILPRFCTQAYFETNPWLRTCLDKAAKDKSMKDYEVSRPVIETFVDLHKLFLPHDTKAALLALIPSEIRTDLPAIIAQIKKLVAVLALVRDAGSALLDSTSSNSSNSSNTLDGQISVALQNALFAKSPLNMERYADSFGKFRVPETLLIYASHIRNMSLTRSGLGKFVTAVLDGEFPAIRYRNIDLFERMDPSLVQRWRSEQIETLDAKPVLFAPKVAGKPPADDEIIKARIVDYGHLDLAPFPHLARALGVQGPVPRELAQSPPSPFEAAMISWLKTPSASLLQEVSSLLSTEQPQAELLHDLEMLREDPLAPGSAGDARAGWRLRFTDDFEQLMRMGSDVKGSCQRVDGNATVSRGLIGTILDGRSRLCLIQDETGRIVGRMVLRLMWNETSDKPCLLAEPIYPDKLSAELREKLTSFAMRQAQNLGLDLICYGNMNRNPDFKVDDSQATTDKLWSGTYEYPPFADCVRQVADRDFRLPAGNRMRRVYRHQSSEDLQHALV